MQHVLPTEVWIFMSMLKLLVVHREQTQTHEYESLSWAYQRYFLVFDKERAHLVSLKDCVHYLLIYFIGRVCAVNILYPIFFLPVIVFNAVRSEFYHEAAIPLTIRMRKKKRGIAFFFFFLCAFIFLLWHSTSHSWLRVALWEWACTGKSVMNVSPNVFSQCHARVSLLIGWMRQRCAALGISHENT